MAALARGVSRAGAVGAISNAIAGALAEHGGEIRTSAGVQQVLVENRKAVGVVLENGDEIRARIVVSNLDAKRTFTRIMDKNDLPQGIYEKARNFKIRGSSGKVNDRAVRNAEIYRGTGQSLPQSWRAGFHRLTGNHGARLRLLEAWPLV